MNRPMTGRKQRLTSDPGGEALHCLTTSLRSVRGVTRESASDAEQPIEEGPVPLKGNAQVLGGDILAAGPLFLELRPFSSERAGQ
jgi:hypothetical protein